MLHFSSSNSVFRPHKYFGSKQFERRRGTPPSQPFQLTVLLTSSSHRTGAGLGLSFSFPFSFFISFFIWCWGWGVEGVLINLFLEELQRHPSKVEFLSEHRQPNHHHLVDHQQTEAKMSDDDDGFTYSPEEIECLKDRKWWCFLLSSIFTFLAGLLIVLLWRALSIICCRKDPPPEYSQSDLKQQNLPKPPRQVKEEFEGTFVTDAKDWAGELISGQTTTGRILVTQFYSKLLLLAQFTT